jgi:hypothetical protein
MGKIKETLALLAKLLWLHHDKSSSEEICIYIKFSKGSILRTNYNEDGKKLEDL